MPAAGETSSAGGLTLGEVLALPVVQAGLPHVVVGDDRLSRLVGWTHVIELPDPRRLLRGGELVLTTGFGMPPTPAGRRTWVERIVEQDAAALAVELGVVFPNELPQGISEACEAAGLPLVVFRRRVAFVELTRVIDSAIVTRGSALTELVSEVQSDLIDMLAREHSTSRILDAVAERIRVPLVLESAGHDIVHCAFGGMDESAVFRVLADLHRYEPGGIGDTALAVGLPRGDGRIIGLELETPLGPQHRAIISAVARAISLNLGRAGVSELNAVSKAQFLDDLAAGRLSARQAEERAALLGFTPKQRLVAVGARHRAAPGEPTSSAWLEFCARSRQRLEKSELQCLLGSMGEELTGLIESTMERDELRAVVANAMHEMCAKCGIAVTDVLLVFSDEADSWPDAGTRLAAVERRARVAELSEWREWFDTGEVDLGNLLYDVRESPALARFVEDRLGPLANGDSRSAVALETLAALVAHGGRKAGAAKALHLDRSALYQRIRRIEDVLGCDLGDPRTLLSVHVALEAQAVLRRYPSY